MTQYCFELYVEEEDKSKWIYVVGEAEKLTKGKIAEIMDKHNAKFCNVYKHIGGFTHETLCPEDEVVDKICDGTENELKPVFRVRLKCENCGHEWCLKCTKYDEVVGGMFGVYVANDRTDKTDFVRCPVCGLSKHVLIVERKPIMRGMCKRGEEE